MVAKKHNLRKQMAEVLEIPAEVALGAIQITITGSGSLQAENHQGIIEYLPGKIVFKTSEGQVEVLGTALTLAALTQETLTVAGEIKAVLVAKEDDLAE